MGHFNLDGGRHINNEKLKHNICIVCDKKGIEQFFGDHKRMSFDYTCKHCNPNTIISIGDITLMGSLLDELSQDKEAIKNLQKEISLFDGPTFKLHSDVLTHFLTLRRSNRSATYNDWLSGKMIGRITSYPNITTEELDRITVHQRKIFAERVEEKLDQLINAFTNRSNDSLDPTRMIEFEIDAVKNIIIKDRYKPPHKLGQNDEISFGIYTYQYHILVEIQHQYEKAVNGKLDYSYITSPNQTIGVAAIRAVEKCMVDAVALGKFLKFLEDNQIKSSKQDAGSRFTDSEISELSKKIDSIKSIILQHFHDTNAGINKVHFELQTGQQIIFDELDEMKALLPSLKKKNWVEIVKAKLIDLVLRNIIDPQFCEGLFKQLTNQDLKLSM